MNDERPRLRNRRTFVITPIIALVALVSLGGGGGLATAKSRDILTAIAATT
jgi:hypothetical protein